MAIVTIICVTTQIGALFCLYLAFRKDAKANKKLQHVEEREKRLKGLHESPTFGYFYTIDLENHRVLVGGKWIIDGYVQDVCFKEFFYNPNDADDKAFAIREAEKLIYKLKEK